MFASLRRLRRLVRNEDGLTATEYAVMLALISMVCLSAVRALSTEAHKVFYNMGEKLMFSRNLD